MAKVPFTEGKCGNPTACHEGWTSMGTGLPKDANPGVTSKVNNRMGELTLRTHGMGRDTHKP